MRIYASCWFVRMENNKYTPNRPFQFTIFAAILLSRQSGPKYESLHENFGVKYLFNNTLVSKTLWIDYFKVTREELNGKIWGM